MADNVERDVFSILVVADKDAKKETLKSLDEIKNKQKEVVKEVEAMTLSYGEAAEQIRHLNREQLELEGQLEALEDSWKGNNLQLERYEQRLQSVQRSTELAGSIGGNVGRLGGVAGQFGLQGVSDAAQFGTGVTDLLESLPQLKVQLQTLGEVARTSTSFAGKFVTNLGNAAAAIPLVSAPIASLTLVLLPLAAAIGGVLFFLDKYNKGMEAQRKQLEATLKAVQATNQAIAEGLTSDQAEQRLEELRRSREAEVATLETAQGAYDSMTQQLNESLGILSGPITAGIQAFDSREEQLVSTINESRDAISNMDAEIALLEARMEDGSLEANDLAEAEAALTEERTAAIDAAKAEADSIREQLNSSIEQEREMLQERKDAERDANEVAALEQKFALEDQQEQEREHYANLANIASEGRQNVETLEKELVSSQTEGIEELQKIEKQGRKEIDKLNKEFFDEQLKANKEFAKETERIDEDTARERLRLIQDINDQMQDAASSNDVIAFLSAQKEGAKELRRNAEDANTEEKRRIEDFLQAQEEAQEAYAKQHQEVLESIKEEKQASIEASAQRKADIEAQIKAEKEAIQTAIREERKRYVEQEAQEAKAADRERQRNELTEMQENRAFQQRLTQINQEQAAWQSTFNTITAGIQRLNAQAGQMAVSPVAGTSNRLPYNSNNYVSPFSSYTIGSNSQSFGSQPQMNFSPQFNTTVGDIATTQQVTNALKDFGGQMMTGFVNFVKGTTK